ncbi:hypothetical protein [Enterovibrio norvegicus]|uniref:hypothetical protein n=1 Tax=Enterovibrio norvegicus TaxID=188144 RepID=UPI000C841E00|nr:hypothetical protein [Enterovibrio norvegicus]PMI35088.1 hypothetical protein BCU47_23885 [Enterovibrio norvegicus]
MGDFEYLKRLYKIEDHNACDLIDRILEKDQKISADIDIRNLHKGMCVHKVWLTKTKPAKVFQVHLNHTLITNVDLSNYNYLDNDEYDYPGSWFVSKEFCVRSCKHDSYWLQYAFTKVGSDNLTRQDIMDYLDVIGFEYDPYKIGDTEVVLKI